MGKKSILFLALSGKNWMGGVYYIKNQIMQLLSYKPSRKKFNIYLYTSIKNKNEYEELKRFSNVHIVYREEVSTKLFYQIGNSLCKEIDMDILYLTFKYNISFIFPYFPKGDKNKLLFLKKSIAWIPDFQHEHLPQFFSKREIADRNKSFEEIAKEHNKLVLSSKDAHKDYLCKFSKYDNNVYVIPFCSALNRQNVRKDAIQDVKRKYGIKGKYFIVCNQFWVHKNHLLVFEALKKAREFNKEIQVVCTGATEDKRNRKYYKEVKQYIRCNELDNNIFLLGLIDKEEQVQLLKGAVALIQPSLFEGWGTCVEDAKTLGKRILLSDIAVHYEQMDDNCQIFRRDDSEQLASGMIEIWNSKIDAEYQNVYNFKNAPRYGEQFYKMLLE